jgi:hypothetical protein
MKILLICLFLGAGSLFNGLCLVNAESSQEDKKSSDKPEAKQGNELKITQTFKGTFSGVTQAKNVAINKKEDWEILWKEVHSTTLPLPPMPEIDFTKYTALATFMGQKATGGYAISIPKVIKKDKDILVLLESKEPPQDVMVIQAITAPYYMIVVPKIEDEKMIQWQSVQ